MHVEASHSPTLFRLVSFSLLFPLFAVIASLLRGVARNCAIVLASLALGLSVMEAAATFLEPKQIVVTTDGWNGRRPILGWAPQHPGVFHSDRIDPKTGAVIYSADYTIDANLLRETRSGDANPTIVFVGDSFTFGLGVDDADTMPQQFADLIQRKQRVINLGFTGYGPQHFLREMQTGLFDQAIGPDPGVFVFLTSPWHAERTSCKASWVIDGPRYEIENGKLVDKGQCYEGDALKLRQFMESSALYRFALQPYRSTITAKDVEGYIAIIIAAVDLAKTKYHAPTIVPYLNGHGYLAQTGFTDATIIERLRQGGAMVIDASLEKEFAEGQPLVIKGDGHPTALAHRLRMEALKAYIEQNLPGVLQPKPN
ncbi:conserved hypothetical protein [Methylocella silvestris BL2]|uniref:SGNH hydrolase-type esterase domain-containing protein n=1 Tax=Methylocella silvestris (strain DSM 15510 / CIP 108128 / LMG 27833 / NCIMB 13906 / BL2) TaxID=395965 RepID=B8ELD7_METSB|nr:SGNH/GDSL hydrolase family protein [Methylocella silvestris]ACK49526.1 conserved hypothetical protein [Methylocella silvestris BL2]